MSINFITLNNTIETVRFGVVTAASHSYAALSVIGPIALDCFKFYTVYSIYESALSDILCLRTFRHGTSPYAVARIAWTGPNLTLAGKSGEAAYIKTTRGVESPWAERDQARKAFYVVDDSAKLSSLDDLPACLRAPVTYTLTKFNAKYYALRSSAQFIGSLLPLPKSWKGRLAESIVETIETQPKAGILGLLCPTVKFHIDPKRIDSNQEDGIELNKDDKSAGPGAMWTQHQFSVLDIGILGALKNGINRELFKRINEHRGQFVWGIAQLVTAVVFTVFFFPGALPIQIAKPIAVGLETIFAFEKKYGFDNLIEAVPIVYAGLQL